MKKYNIYELYLKNHFTKEELKEQYKIKSFIDKFDNNFFITTKTLILFLLCLNLIITTFVFIEVEFYGVQYLTFLNFLISFDCFLFFLYLIGFFINLKLKSFKQQLKIDFKDIIQKPDYFIFLQNKIQEIYNFDTQKAFEFDFKNVDEIGESKIIKFLGFNYLCEENYFHCSFYPKIKKIFYIDKTYSFDTTKNLLLNKMILIEILSLIKLPSNFDENKNF